MVESRGTIQTPQQKYCRQRNLLTFSQLKFPYDRHDKNKHSQVGRDVGYTHTPPVAYGIDAFARGRYHLPAGRKRPTRREGGDDPRNRRCYDYATYEVAGDTVWALDEDAEVCGQDRKLGACHGHAVQLLDGVSAFGPVDDGLRIGGCEDVDMSADAGYFNTNWQNVFNSSALIEEWGCNVSEARRHNTSTQLCHSPMPTTHMPKQNSSAGAIR